MILVVDNYDSFTYNLVHLVAERAPDVEVRLNDRASVPDVEAMSPEAILISPGPGRPSEAGAAKAVIEAFGETTPILGVCLGLQAIAEVFGASLVEAPQPMHGKTSAIWHDDEGVLAGLPQGFKAMRYHSLVVERGSVPDVLMVTATAEDGDIMGLRHRVFPVEGVQFHPESILSPDGPRLIGNWLDKVARFAVQGQRSGRASPS